MSGDQRIRLASVEDAPAIAALHVRAWQWAYRGLIPDAVLASLSVEQRRERWSKVLLGEEPNIRVWLCARQGQLVGFVASGRAQGSPSDKAVAEVYALFQEESVVGTGVGRALFQRALIDLRVQRYRRAFVWVLDSDSRARRFFERAGFTADGGQKSEMLDGHPLKEVRYECALVL